LSAPTDWTENTLHVTDEPDAVNLDFVVEMLRTSYWASNRPRELIEDSWRASLPFTMFDGADRIGFARAVTDRATFSWIADVVVHPDHRGRGAGRFLMQCVVSHPDIARTKICLATRDAHAFYESLGFTRGEAMWKLPAGMSGPTGSF
jgi:GNAT superfamily N-acetyltransferase